MRKDLENRFIVLMIAALKEAINERKVKRLETYRDGLWMGWANSITPTFKKNCEILLNNVKSLSLKDKDLIHKIELLNEEAKKLDFNGLTRNQRTIGISALSIFFKEIGSVVELYNMNKGF